MRGMLAFVLRKHGYFVTGARDGRQALEYLDDLVLERGHRRMPQLLLTDQRMPGFHGLGLIEATRAAGMREMVLGGCAALLPPRDDKRPRIRGSYCPP